MSTTFTSTMLTAHARQSRRSMAQVILVEHEHTPTAVLEALYSHWTQQQQKITANMEWVGRFYSLLAHPNLPDALRYAELDTSKTVAFSIYCAIVENTKLSEQAIAEGIGHLRGKTKADGFNQYQVATLLKNFASLPNASADMLREFDLPLENQIVHYSFPERKRTQIIQEGTALARTILAQNPTLSETHIRALAFEENKYTFKNLALHPNTPRQLLEGFIQYSYPDRYRLYDMSAIDKQICLNATAHPNIPEDVARAVYRKAVKRRVKAMDPFIIGAASNPNVGEDVAVDAFIRMEGRELRIPFARPFSAQLWEELLELAVSK